MATVYEHARTIPDSRTAVLELFAHQQLLTPAEIGVELGNGQPLTKGLGRAFLRNFSRMADLLEQGRISRRVLVKDFAGYETEGAGRYGFSDEGKATLRGQLGPA